MKRDPRLRALSHDHHHALVLARFIAAIDVRSGIDAEVVALVKERFETEIAPHFAVEELLLRALEGMRPGLVELAKRARDDHARMLHLVERASAHEGSALAELAGLLMDHVRFEERELYPACEHELPSEVLDDVARVTTRSSAAK